MKILTTLSLALVILAAPHVLAQQNNSATASLLINGSSGPPYPISGVLLPRGVVSVAVLNGAPGAPWLGYVSSGLLANGFPVLNAQLVDLAPAGLALVYDGIANPAFSMDQTGMWLANFTIAPSTPLGTSRAFQAVVADPTSSSNVRLTAATQVVVSPGVTTVVVPGSDDGSVSVSLATFSTSFPYYGSTYTSFFINMNGFVSFGSPDGDFTPTIAEFRGGVPRIAPFWVDLSANTGGTVSYSVNESVSPPVVRVNFTNVPEFSLPTATHTFSIEMDMLVGNFRMISDPFNAGAAGFSMITGFTPGQNLSTLAAVTNLSTLFGSSTLTNLNDALFEEFGANVGGAGGNPYDLTGTTLNADFVSPGVYVVY
jgi:hypothetical protein